VIPSFGKGRRLRKLAALVCIGLLGTSLVAACEPRRSSGNQGFAVESATARGTTVGVIMPTKTGSRRWLTDDPTALKAAFDAAKVPVDIQNAEGDSQKFIDIATAMITAGVKVLVIVSIDPDSGKTVIAKAKAKGVFVIDYDRLTLNGGADYYVSFDGIAVGRLQGEAMVRCLAAKGVADPVVAELNGSPTDNNASLFKEGYDSVLQPQYDAGRYRKGPDQFVPGYDGDQAKALFEQMLSQQPEIRGVLAATDGLANAVIPVLAANKLTGKVALTGQDATVPGLQNMLAGTQCATIYKDIKREAESAAQLAVSLSHGTRVQLEGRTKDKESATYIPSVLLQPRLIEVGDIKDLVSAGIVAKAQLCTRAFAAACSRNGIK
jgi:D-xylose transport system substrate-binding protein